MRTIILIFLYFIVINSFPFHITIKRQLIRLDVALITPPSPPSEDTYDEETKKINNTISIIYKKRKRLLDGYDGRFVENNNTEHSVQTEIEETRVFMTKFQENYEKLQLLKKLENTNIPITQKIHMLAPREIRPARINIETLDW